MANKKLKVHQFRNGITIKALNKRISVTTLPNKIGITFQACLPKEELTWANNFIKRNYKQTSFGLTRESAELLYQALGRVLIMPEPTQEELNNPENYSK